MNNIFSGYKLKCFFCYNYWLKKKIAGFVWYIDFKDNPIFKKQNL